MTEAYVPPVISRCHDLKRKIIEKKFTSKIVNFALFYVKIR